MKYTENEKKMVVLWLDKFSENKKKRKKQLSKPTCYLKSSINGVYPVQVGGKFCTGEKYRTLHKIGL
jgi:hypothetical protein